MCVVLELVMRHLFLNKLLVYFTNGVMPEEPDLQPITASERSLTPPTSTITDDQESGDQSSCDPLEQSMKRLHEGLESGHIIFQFEHKLYSKKSGESMESAKTSDNAYKNRYRDIFPYDSTRVALNDCLTGDYINASFVNMEIPDTGVINKYIATQGPIKDTIEDFWQMVWEQKCELIIMMTQLEEKGRKKCYKYWPEESEELTIYGTYKVSLIKQTDTETVIEREFRLEDCKTREEHCVTHLQYLTFPDHGVPDEDNDFIEFIFKVRKLKQNSTQPVIVHCSAGIGRTGVLILIDTGICLIEANQAVEPLELVRKMRDQRAMLIQTHPQFVFACQSLFRLYKEKVVQTIEVQPIEDQPIEDQPISSQL